MTSNPVSVARASAEDVDALSDVIADAFYDLPPSRWLIGDPAARREIFPRYFKILVEHAIDGGIVHTTADRAAVALWIPAGDQPQEPPSSYDARLRDATGPWASRFLAFDAALAARHPAGVPHHHLAILAVQRGRQDRGTGTALLEAHHRELDQAGTPAYLEAADLRTRGFYLRRGYAVHGQPIRLPGGPRMFPLWRDPAARPPDADTERCSRPSA